MSLYYVLLEDEYTGDRMKIGNIMLKLNDILYEQTKLKLGICTGLAIDDIESFDEISKLKVLHEEVLWKNMTMDERTSKILDYLKLIGGISGELLIVDPYMFCYKAEKEYKEMVKSVFCKCGCERIQIITDKNKFDETFCKEIRQSVNTKLEVYFSDDFHDRFWIANEKKGFLMGTSLNGIGKKYTSIVMLNEEDVREIVRISTQIIKEYEDGMA